MRQRNLLILVIDCLRADFVYEKGLAHTPVIDRLARDGFGFLNAISTTTTTTPSFASLLTGKYPFEHGVRSHSGYRLSESAPTLAEMLRQGGYHTYAEMSGPLVQQVGLAKGFSAYNLRTRKETIHRDWGQQLLRKFDGYFQEPWFVLLHVWSLHRPRQVIPECREAKFGNTDYGRALSSIDAYLDALFERVPEDTVVVLTGDHGEDIVWGRLRNKWAKIRESPEWVFVHPWERRFVNEKLDQGWEAWSDEDVRVLSALIFEIGKRSAGV